VLAGRRAAFGRPVQRSVGGGRVCQATRFGKVAYKGPVTSFDDGACLLPRVCQKSWEQRWPCWTLIVLSAGRPRTRARCAGSPRVLERI
jgi:hypothetical protein